MTSYETFAEVMTAVFLALSQAMGPKTLLNASVLLAELSQKSTGPKARTTLNKILSGMDTSAS